MQNTDIDIIKKIIKSRKHKTNCFSFYNEVFDWIDSEKADLFLIEGCVFIFLKANTFYKFYYYVKNFKEIKYAKELLDHYSRKSEVSLEFTTTKNKDLEEISDEIKKINFNFYATFARLRGGVNKVKYKEKEKENGVYELAELKHKKSLLKIMSENFNFITDNIPTDEEIEKLINNKAILIRHLDKKIIYIQIYEYSKGALYSRLTWIRKEYRKPKYTVDIYNGIDRYIEEELGIKDFQNIRAYYWIDTSIRNYKIAIKQDAVLDGLTCTTFMYEGALKSED